MGFAAYGKSCQLIYIATMLWRERSSCGRPLNAPAAFIQTCQPIFAILLIAAVPVYAHAQKPTARVSKGDAQKVVTIISGDKAKTHLLRYKETRRAGHRGRRPGRCGVYVGSRSTRQPRKLGSRSKMKAPAATRANQRDVLKPSYLTWNRLGDCGLADDLWSAA